MDLHVLHNVADLVSLEWTPQAAKYFIGAARLLIDHKPFSVAQLLVRI